MVGVAEIKAETDAAFLIKLPDGHCDKDGKSEFWVPKSQVEDAEDFSKGDVDVEMPIAIWWCRDRDVDVAD